MTAVEGMAEQIEARRLALHLTVQDLIDRTGLTRPGLAPLLRGERRRYQERLTLPVCRELRWTPDSIERLLAGEPPIEIEISSPDEIAQLRDRVARLERAVERLLEEADAMPDADELRDAIHAGPAAEQDAQ